MEETHKTLKPHAIMIPASLQGHINPFVNLALTLASHGFTITFVNTKPIHHQIVQSQPSGAAGDGGDIFAGARERGLDIRYVTVSDGFPLGFDRTRNHDQFLEGMFHVFSAHVDELVGNIRSSAPEPLLTCLIADTFYGWTSFIAKKHNLINISFWTEPALVFTLYYHLHLLRANGHFASLDNRKDTIDYIPGVGAIEPKDLSSYLQETTDIWTILHRMIYKAYDDVKLSDFILCNTIQELEPEPVLALNQKQPFYAIGPIFPTSLTQARVTTNLWSESNCTHWLDAKPRGSVLYVSFGSLAQVTEQDVVEIAHGLLINDVSFIWVLRKDSNFLCAQLEDDLKRNGLIVTWCSQIDVIGHQAVGGFLTHCGWNSVLESVWCGVPMLCFPLFTDQLTNRKLVVDDWRVGINLCDKRPIRREEVGENIDRLMNRKLGSQMRENIKEVRCTLESAMGPDGSSRRNLNKFIEDVKNKIVNKCGFEWA